MFYRRVPEIIEAVQIINKSGYLQPYPFSDHPKWVSDAIKDDILFYNSDQKNWELENSSETGMIGDWIIKYQSGYLDFMLNKDFQKTYIKVDSE